MIRFLFQIAFSLFLVVAPYTEGVIELTLRMSSTQSEETHEQVETKVVSRVAKKAPVEPPIPVTLDSVRAVVLVSLWAPAAQPTLDPAKYSERRLI